MPDFTVLIPTHDHVDTLRYAVQSVQWQTRQDFELFIVGDGTPDRTRELAAELMASDARVRFFDFPKGERHGEAYRHQVLKQASGRFVCYQSDDDLWFPDHLDAMATLLEDHDLAHCMQIEVGPDGAVSSWMFDAKVDPLALAKMQKSETGFGLNSGGHRLDAYWRLPVGWHPAPRGINTDLYFWLQFLNESWCRYISYKWPNVVHLSSVTRRDWASARRVEELAEWWDRIQAPSERGRLSRECLVPLHDRLVQESFQSSSGVELVRAIEQLVKSTEVVPPAVPALPTYALGDQLDFCINGNATRYALSNFSYPEAWGRWTMGAVANMVLPLREPVMTDLLLDLAVLPFLHGEYHPICAFTLLLNGSVVFRVCEARPAINLYEVRIPRALCEGLAVLAIGFSIDDPVRPVNLGMSGDARLLGIGLVTLKLSEAESPAE